MSYREPTSNEPSLGSCVDISPSGMFIETVRPAARGVLVRFECVCTEPQGVVRGTARVMWIRPHNDAQGRAGMGVRFVRLEPGSTRIIDELIARTAPNPEARMQSDGPEARRHSDEPSVVLTAERTIGPTHRSSSVPPKGDMRAPTLRGMIPADVRSAASSDARSNSNNPPPARRSEPPSYRGGPSANPLPDARNAAGSNALRERVAASSRAPAAPGSSPSVTTSITSAVSDGTIRSTSSDGSTTSPASDNASQKPSSKSLNATVHNLAPPPELLSSPSGNASRQGSDHALGVPSPPPPPWKARQSERPPAPGGVEVIRSVSVSSDVRMPDGHSKATRVGNPSPENLSSQPKSYAGARVHTSSNATQMPHDLPGAEDAHRPEWEPIVEPARPPIRPDRPPPVGIPYVLGTGESEEESKPGRSWLGWIVVGSGGVVALLLTLLFGKGPVGIPGGVVAETPPSAASLNPEATFVTPTAEGNAPAPAPEATQVVLFARVEPEGARITALGQTIVSPGRFTFPVTSVQWPLSVRAEMAGYGATELKLPRHVFEDGPQGLTHELMLSLQATDTAAAGTSAPASGPAADPARSDRKSSRSSGSKAAAQTGTAAEVAPQPSAASEAAMSTAPPPSPDSPTEDKPAETKPAEASAASSPLTRALECLSRGDNACVVSELEGSQGARELDLLIETYRATGNTSAAEKSMARYLELHPEGRRASQYRRALGVVEPATP